MGCGNKYFNLPEGIDVFSADFATDVARWGTLRGVGEDVYVIKNNEILCTARIGSSYNGHVRIYLNSPEAFEIFKDVEVFKVLGKDGSLPFNQVTGWFEMCMTRDDDDEFCLDLTIVDKLYFDLGISSKMRFGHIPGFGEGRTVRTIAGNKNKDVE